MNGEKWSHEEYLVSELMGHMFSSFYRLCFINLFEKFTIQKHSFYCVLFVYFWKHFSYLYKESWCYTLIIVPFAWFPALTRHILNIRNLDVDEIIEKMHLSAERLLLPCVLTDFLKHVIQGSVTLSHYGSVALYRELWGTLFSWFSILGWNALR